MGHSSNNGKHYYKYKIAQSLCESYHNDGTPFSNEQLVNIYASIVSSGLVLQMLTESRNAIYELIGLCNHYDDLKTYIINENKHKFFIDSYIQTYVGIHCSSVEACMQDESIESMRKFFGLYEIHRE